MQNKGFIITLTVIITVLCVYYLSFTLVGIGVQNDAEAYATTSDGVVHLDRKQSYIDSVWNKPVYNFFGAEFTYSEVKDKELSFGLDLQGGMHVTLEVSPADIIRSLAGSSTDSSLVKSLAKAKQLSKTTNQSYTSTFFRVYKEANPGKKLSSLFANATTKGKISLNDSDDKVESVVEDEVENAIDRSYTILKNRLDQFGTSAPTIQRLPGTGRIQIEIPGADNPQRVRKLLSGVARLEFWDVADGSQLQGSLIAINDLIVKEQKAAAAKTPVATTTTEVVQPATPVDSTSIQSDLEKKLASDSSLAGLDSLQNMNISPIFSLANPPNSYRYSVRDTSEINKIFRRSDVRGLMRSISVFWANKPDKDQAGNEALQLYFLNLGRTGKAKLTGEVITDARQTSDEYARPAVSMTMNVAGTKAWAKMTAEAASKSPRGSIAIVLDNVVYSAPFVQNEIPNGNSQISGNFTPDEAKDLASVLKAGSLPAPTRIVEEATVGPTLGQLAQDQGLISMACGLALVVIFMVAYYSKGGLVANLALLFNIFFILGILAQPTLGTSLTLPGIAGIVLTMGMAVDANILIYERIKEELSHGRKLKDAIKVGYDRAFGTILDSNMTTLITAFLLAWLGQGPIRGFAVTLIIGIISSFFTAVYISRVFIDWMTRKGDESTISFDSPIARLVKKRKHYDFVKNARMAYTISSVIIVIGFVLIFIQGFNLGVDFKGGRSYVVAFKAPVNATELRNDLVASFENTGTEVKNYGSNNVMRVTTSYLIDDESENADERVKQALISGIEKKFPTMKYTDNETKVDDTHFAIPSASKVEATVADDIKGSAWKASLFSLLGIFIYILIRFHKWQYSVGAIAATIHDTLFVFAAFGIARVFGISFELDQVFVAAVLTIIGYSINDTVIIFDRIREYLGQGTSHDRSKIFNDAINDTLSRTIITAGTILMVVVVLLIFGGEVLRGFSFALIVGVVVGTFSSIYIASPVVLDLDKLSKSKNPQPDTTAKKPVTA